MESVFFLQFHFFWTLQLSRFLWSSHVGNQLVSFYLSEYTLIQFFCVFLVTMDPLR